MVACMLDAEPELVNMRGPGGVSPLHLAPTREIAAMLVQRGGDIEADYVSHARQTPLHSAAVEGRQEVVEYLLDQGEAGNIFAAVDMDDGARVGTFRGW